MRSFRRVCERRQWRIRSGGEEGTDLVGSCAEAGLLDELDVPQERSLDEQQDERLVVPSQLLLEEVVQRRSVTSLVGVRKERKSNSRERDEGPSDEAFVRLRAASQLRRGSRRAEGRTPNPCASRQLDSGGEWGKNEPW